MDYGAKPVRFKSSSRSSGSGASGAGGGPIGTARSSACWSCAPVSGRPPWRACGFQRPPRPAARGHAHGSGQLIGIELNRDRGDLVQSLGIEPFSPPGGQGLEDEEAHVLRGAWLGLGPSNTDLPAAEASEVPQEVRNGLDLSICHGSPPLVRSLWRRLRAVAPARRALSPTGPARDIAH